MSIAAKSSKMRLDVAITEKNLAPSRHLAQAFILAGKVFVNGIKIEKPGHFVALTDVIIVRKPEHQYVSRGALKLLRAISVFRCCINDKVAVDLGASTGGFTQVLLEKNARCVYAIDVGYNQLAYSLRINPRVISQEKVNARYLKRTDFNSKIDVVVSDLSFISLTKVARAVADILNGSGYWITLIKPQFEVGPDLVGKGGIVRDDSVRFACLRKIVKELTLHQFTLSGLTESPIQGADGNIEFLALWKPRSELHL